MQATKKTIYVNGLVKKNNYLQCYQRVRLVVRSSNYGIMPTAAATWQCSYRIKAQGHFKVVRGQVSIAHGHFYVVMAKDFLQVKDVAARHHEVCCKRVE